ncbi:DEAD/DEAH box helicase [Achromobacter deleyi]|uniref:DEAD/DEAH box helicase n=1 Tax=Achromobacter deleyi TaxID=1353891 RepID=UPI002FCD6673
MLEVVPRYLPVQTSFTDNAAIQEIFRQLAVDEARTASIANEIVRVFQEGGKILVLTERTDHLDMLHTVLAGRVQPLFVLHGRQSKRQRASVISALVALESDVPRVLLASGRLIGEGFDHPPLDTLVLAMPISWKGTLQQYAGRLHREQAGKQHVRIIDFIDPGHPSLLRMWERRRRGYHAMGYRVIADEERNLELPV